MSRKTNTRRDFIDHPNRDRKRTHRAKAQTVARKQQRAAKRAQQGR